MRKMLFIAVSLAMAAGLALAGTSAPARPTTITAAVTGFHCQACPDQLARDLAKLPGVIAVRATMPGQVTAKLDETKTPAGRLVAAIAAHPQLMDPRKTYGARLVVYVDSALCQGQPKMCPACAPEITKRLKAVKGINAVSFDKSGCVVSIGFAQGATVKTTDIARALAASSFKFGVRF